jgi:hypothetical protein
MHKRLDKDHPEWKGRIEVTSTRRLTRGRRDIESISDINTAVHADHRGRPAAVIHNGG